MLLPGFAPRINALLSPVVKVKDLDGRDIKGVHARLRRDMPGCGRIQSGFFMKQIRSAILVTAALLLAGCAQFERNTPQAAVDDDAICRAQGERGSSPYVACMKDRDAAASRGGNERIERAHRNLAEDMLNNRR